MSGLAGYLECPSDDPGLEVTELQQSHYTIHLQSEIAPSLPDHLLVTAVVWER